MDSIITVKDLKSAIKNLPDDTKILISSIDIDSVGTISQNFARNICLSTNNDFIIISNKTLFSINPLD